MLQTVLPPRVDFNRNDFDNIIYQKGRDVLFEKSLLCPCKGKSTNQQSNCKNCGGTGYIFYNPKKTRMVVQGLSVVSETKAWSEESRGTVNITCNDDERLSYMDRITILDGTAIHQEVVFFKKSSQNEWFCYTAYPVKKILYAGLFQTTLTPLLNVSELISTPTDKPGIIKLSLPLNVVVDKEYSVTLRYEHAPSFHVIEMRRESMQSFKLDESTQTEINQKLPLSALGRRSHYVLTAPQLYGDRLLDNSFDESQTCN